MPLRLRYHQRESIIGWNALTVAFSWLQNVFQNIWSNSCTRLIWDEDFLKFVMDPRTAAIETRTSQLCRRYKDFHYRRFGMRHFNEEGQRRHINEFFFVRMAWRCVAPRWLNWSQEVRQVWISALVFPERWSHSFSEECQSRVSFSTLMKQRLVGKVLLQERSPAKRANAHSLL